MIIVPIYGAEKLSFRFNTTPAIRFEPWNRQIERVAMIDDEVEDIPDVVTVFEGEVTKDSALETIEKLGLDILPFVFGRPYFVYQVANEKDIILRHSTAYSLPNTERKWILPAKLQSFLDVATSSLQKYKLHRVLSLIYEKDFRTSAVEIKFFVLFLTLEILAKNFVDNKRKSILSDDAKISMLNIAKNDLITSGNIQYYDFINLTFS